jgi:hypothetical protein
MPRDSGVLGQFAIVYCNFVSCLVVDLREIFEVHFIILTFRRILAMTAIVAALHSTHLFGDRLDIVDVEEADTNTGSSKSSFLVVSPYLSPPHLLDLTRYSTSSRLFAKALTIFRPVRDDYATAEYTESFNFQEVAQTLRSLAKVEGYKWKKTDFYVVSFRSQLKPDADGERLFELDAFSHQEAMASGGLLKYWYGVKDQSRRNLATCTLSSRFGECD